MKHAYDGKGHHGGAGGAGAPASSPNLQEPKAGMKRAISDGDIPNKDNNVKEDQYVPIDINGLFERLAPCDGE